MPRGRGYFFVLHVRWRFRVDFLPYKGMCVVERSPWPVDTSSPARGVLLWERPTMKKRQAKGAGEGGKHLAAVETNVFHQHAALVEHCCCRQYDDGDAREPGWITIKTQGAAWIVQVKDPDSCCSFSAVGDTLDKALDTAQLLLSCEEAPWEPDQFLAASKARKKK